MSAFSQVEQVAAARKPVHTAVVPLAAFSDAWKGRPKAPVCAGFRPLSASDVRSIRAAASEDSFKMHPRDLDEANRIDAFNDAIMRLAVARSVCDPNDVEKPGFLGDCPDDNAIIILSADGVSDLYLEVHKAAVLSSPTRPDATDADLLELFDLLPIALERMSKDRVWRARRLLGSILDECRAFVGADEVTADSDG